MIRVLTTYLLLFASGGAIAADCGPNLAPHAHPAAIFAKAYVKPGLYRRNQCGRNVKELLLELAAAGVAIENAEVLFLLHELRQYAGGPMSPMDLLPSHNRSFERAWNFHVILRLGASIYDLDGPARPMEIREYFNEMFPGAERLSRIALRSIPAPDYLQAFDEYYRSRDPRRPLDDQWVVGDFRSLNLPGYPVTTVRDYLK